MSDSLINLQRIYHHVVATAPIDISPKSHLTEMFKGPP